MKARTVWGVRSRLTEHVTEFDSKEDAAEFVDLHPDFELVSCQLIDTGWITCPTTTTKLAA